MADLTGTLSGNALTTPPADQGDSMQALIDFLDKNPIKTDFRAGLAPVTTAIQNQAPPTPEPVPPAPGAAQSFLAQLGGNLATNTMRNPQFSEQVNQALTSATNLSERTAHGNYVNKQAFDKAKQDQLTAMEMHITGLELEQAIKQGDTKRSLLLIRAQQKLAEQQREKVREENLKDFQTKTGILLGKSLAEIGAKNTGLLAVQDAKNHAKNLEKTLGLLPANAKLLAEQLQTIRQTVVSSISDITNSDEVDAAAMRALELQRVVTEQMKVRDTEERKATTGGEATATPSDNPLGLAPPKKK